MKKKLRMNVDLDKSAATTEEEIEQEWRNLLFDIRRSIRYHSKRAAYYDFLTKSVTATSLILGSGTVAVAIKANHTLSVIIIQTLDMICHNELVRAQGYCKLAKIGWFRRLFCQMFQKDLPLLRLELEKEGIETKF